MAEKSFLKTVIVILLLINVATISYMWLSGRPGARAGPPNGDVVGFLTNELGLSPAQHHQLVQLHDDFARRQQDIHEHLHSLHTPLFALLHNEAVDTGKVSLLVDSMAIYHKQMEWLTFEQFNAIRRICTPEQQKKFDGIVDKT